MAEPSEVPLPEGVGSFRSDPSSPAGSLHQSVAPKLAGPRTERARQRYAGATQQIAVIDLSRDLLQQFTYEWDNANPLWTADGSHLIFRSNSGGGQRRLYWQAADGSGKPEPLTAGAAAGQDQIPTSILGRLVVYETIDPTTRTDIWVLPLDDRKPRPLVQTPFDEGGASFSADGRWLAHQSNQSGRWEVWAQPNPGTGSREQVSQEGGVRPLWQPDSRSIVFQSGANVMSATVSASGVGAPARLFTLEPNDILLDITREGRILVRRTTAQPATSLGLIINWFDHVRRVAGGTNLR